MSAVFWISLAIVSVLSAVVLRTTVRFLARGIENPWDNAFGYGLLTALFFAFPGRWMWGVHSIFLSVLIVPFLWVAQTLTLRIFYQISLKRAWAIGVIHGLVTSTLTALLGLAAGAVAAFILYKKIVTNPLILLRIILRLIGIDLDLDF